MNNADPHVNHTVYHYENDILFYFMVNPDVSYRQNELQNEVKEKVN